MARLPQWQGLHGAPRGGGQLGSRGGGALPGPDPAVQPRGLPPGEPLLGQGIVPDIRYRRNLVYSLVDVKTIGFCESRYGPRGRTRGRRPPDMRADKVHAEYLAKARALDRKWCGTPIGRGVIGPIERRLVSYGRVAGVDFGYYGEMSKDASELLSFAAGEIAARTCTCTCSVRLA